MEIMDVVVIITNILLVFVGSWAIIAYYLNIKNQRKEVAITLVLQIDEIRENMIAVKKTLSPDPNKLDEQAMFETDHIMIENSWNKYKHLLVKKIGASDSATLFKFYRCVESIALQQNNIKNFSMQSLINNSVLYKQQYAQVYVQLYMQQTNENTEATDHSRKQMAYEIGQQCLAPVTYMPSQFIFTLKKYLSEYDGISIEYAYAKLRKIAGIK